MTWDLRLGDCLDPVTGLASLEDQSVDVIITDPPYSEHTHAKQWSAHALTDQRKRHMQHKELGFASITTEQAGAAMLQFARVARRWSAVFTDLEGVTLWRESALAAGLDYVRACVWIKPDATPQFTGDRPAAGAEAIVLVHQPGRKRWNGGGRRGVYVYGREPGGSPHPTTKPSSLMLALVADFTEPDETVLDPFAGSGTTGVAARSMGRNFIGWERDPKYHAIAARRIGETVEQLTLNVKRTKDKQLALETGE